MPTGTIARFGPPLVLMAIIFGLSAQPNLGTGLGTWDTILRKGAHMAEFALLWWLWWRAFEFDRRWAVPAAAITLAYAATDEFHQHFVTGRHASVWDWLIDAIGVGIAIVLATNATRPLVRNERPRVKRQDGSGDSVGAAAAQDRRDRAQQDLDVPPQ